MKKVEKGTPGYLDYKKKIEIGRTLLYFGIVAAIFLLGYSQTHTRRNLLTIVAVLGCLPSSKALVGVIVRFPYSSVSQALAEEVSEKGALLTTCYDLLVTSKESVMPVDCIVISGHNIYGYTRSEKVDLEALGKQIKEMLAKNQYSGLTVKILNQYKPFLARVEGLNNIASIQQEDGKEREEAIRSLILTLSM